MARLNDNGQWIVLMAFIICIVLLILALIVNESTLVGKTTAESVLEFSKSDIQDVKNQVSRIREVNEFEVDPDEIVKNHIDDMTQIALRRKNILLDLDINFALSETRIHFDNGVNQYDERSRFL
jgi:hypothetical protein